MVSHIILQILNCIVSKYQYRLTPNIYQTPPSLSTIALNYKLGLKWLKNKLKGTGGGVGDTGSSKRKTFDWICNCEGVPYLVYITYLLNTTKKNFNRKFKRERRSNIFISMLKRNYYTNTFFCVVDFPQSLQHVR